MGCANSSSVQVVRGQTQRRAYRINTSRTNYCDRDNE